MKDFIDGINNMFEGAEKQANKNTLTATDLQNYKVSGATLKLIKKAIVGALIQGADYNDIKTHY